MAYLNGFSYDVFISYARVDDAEDMPGGLQWVSTFERYLTSALRKRLGRADALSIFFDRRTVRSNDVLSDLEAAARNSALFLAVCSRNYAERDWTLRELAAFESGASDSKRLFAIEIMPLDPGQSYPPSLQSRHRESFMKRTSEVSETMMPLPLQDAGFGMKIHDLAEQLRNQLMAMRVVSEVKSATRLFTEVASEVTAAEGCRVVLGQVTDDLEDEREHLRRHLEQFGHDVRPKGYLRQDAAGFTADLDAALEDAALFVQLLGPARGRMPPDMPRGYIRTQLDQAAATGVPVLQWRSAALQLDTVADPDHRNLLTGETVVASGLEAFKAQVVARLEVAVPPGPAPAGDQSLPMVFIHADDPDLDYARQVRDEFAREGFYAAIPLQGGAQGDLQAYLRENLLDCDGLVMIYGNTTPVWATRNLRHFNKLRSRRSLPPKLVAILVGPPEEKTDDLGLSMPGLRIVGSRHGWRPETIAELIRELRA